MVFTKTAASPPKKGGLRSTSPGVPGAEGQVVLQLGPGSPDLLAGADRPLHLSLVRELLGAEILELIRSELRADKPNNRAAARAHGRDLQGATSDDEDSDWSPREFGHAHSGAVSVTRTTSLANYVKPASSKGSRLSRVGEARIPGAAPEPGSADLVDMDRQTTTETTDSKQKAKVYKKYKVNQLRRMGSTGWGEEGLHVSAKRLLERWNSFEAQVPRRGARLRRLLEGCAFEAFITLVIVLNCIFMVYAVNNEAKNPHQDTPPTIVVVAELMFFVVYLVEAVVKLLAYQLHYFLGPDGRLNCLDFLLVITSAIQVTEMFSTVVSFLPNLTQLRAVRVFKLLKILRVLRVMNRFKRLRTMLVSIAQSFSTLFWSMVMLILFIFMFSLLFVQRTAVFLEGGGSDAEVEALFGSVESSMLTLFATTSGGTDWLPVYEVLSATGFLVQAIFMAHLIFIQVAIVNIITGMFVETAMKSMSSEREHQAMEYRQEEKQQEADLRRVCHQADLVGQRRLSREDFEDALSRECNQALINLLGLRVQDVTEFFGMLSDVAFDGRVDIDEFVEGCMRMRGSASCFDMLDLMAELHSMKASVAAGQAALHSLIKKERRAKKKSSSGKLPAPEQQHPTCACAGIIAA